MDYTSLITRNKQYKYSANVCFDLRNAARLSGFIPNETTTGILREYVGDIIREEQIHIREFYMAHMGQENPIYLLCLVRSLVTSIPIEKNSNSS